MRRREALKTLTLAVPTLVLPACGGADGRAWWSQPIAASASFPCGVVASLPDERGGVILVALVEEVVGPRRVGVEIAADPGFSTPLYRLGVDLPDEPGVPVRVLAQLPALAGRATLHYRFVTERVASPTGRFRTPPAVTDDRPVRLAYFSCQGWQPGYFAAHAGLAAERDLDLALCLGDYIYERTDDTGPRADTIGARGDGFAESLEEYRAKYRLYRSDESLRAMHAAHPFLAVWDNHELAAEYADARISLAERGDNGRRAFWEWMPMAPGPADRVLYRSVRLGARVELFLLDLHSHAAPIASGGSYLGEAQRTWLVEALATSRARWKLLGSATVMMGLDLAPGSPVNTNQWDGYPEERRAIVEHVRDRGLRGVVAISGDLHTYLGGQVTTTGRSDGLPGFPELAGGAISSLGLLDLAPDQTTLARNLEDAARELNPHLVYMDALAKGYVVVEAGEDLVLVCRAVDNVLDPQSPTRDLARLRVVYETGLLERLA